MASVIIFLLLMMSLTVFLSYFPFFLSSRLLHFPFSPFCLVIHLLFVPAGGVNLSVKMYSDLYQCQNIKERRGVLAKVEDERLLFKYRTCV